MNFKEFGFEQELLEGLDAMGFTEPTPIQQQSIPHILNGKDIIACAQTGTGKTAAFVLPILNHLCKTGSTGKVSTVILSPTRELAQQIDQQVEGFGYFTGAASLAIYGGGDSTGFEVEKQALVKGADIVVCTPGRILSHLNIGYWDTTGVTHLVLDEADRMLDMGFYNDIMRIVAHFPKQRQNLLFSATMPSNIRDMAKRLLVDPVTVNIAISKPAEGILQAAYLVNDNQKIDLTANLLKDKEMDHILIFSSRKSSVKSITKKLNSIGIPAQEVHSDLDQSEREKVLLDFRNKKARVVVATDVLSRGIDIKGINLVLNFDVPNDAEDYVHRIGRTARADNTGVAITYINADEVDKFMSIERLIEREVPKVPLPEGFESGPEYVSGRRNRNKGGKGYKGKRKYYKGKPKRG